MSTRRILIPLFCFAALAAPAWSQQDASSGSYASHCTIIVPAAQTVSSASFATFAVVGVLDGTQARSGSFLTRLDPLCGGMGGTGPGGCQTTLCGDCNGDGIISILDALAAARHAVMSITLMGADFSNCDVDGDGDVDVLDSLLLAQFSAGLPVVLSCC